MLTAEPLSSSATDSPSSRAEIGQVSYPEVAALASNLSDRIARLSRLNKSTAERRRLEVLRDAASKIHACLTNQGVR